MIAAAAILLAGCAKNEGGDENVRSVRVSIKQAGVTTRALGTHITDAQPVTFSSGKLLFTNNANEITKEVTVSNDSAPYSTTAVGKGTLEAGAWITGVPSSSTKVFFIGNPPGDISPAIALGAKVSDLMINVKSQYDTGGNVGNVTLWGGDDLTTARTPATGPSGGSLTANDYEATFDVVPISARLEIGEIVAKHSGGGTLTFTLEGVFIDRYYDRMKVYGPVSASAYGPLADAGDLKSNGSVPTMYLRDGNDGGTPPAASSYTTAMQYAVYDYNSGGMTANPAPQMFAYNVLADDASVPSIIIRVKDVNVNGTPWAGSHFLTITKLYSDPSGANTLITALEQGRVYTIPSLEFDENDLKPTPYAGDKNAYVTVTLLNWEQEDVGYDID